MKTIVISLKMLATMSLFLGLIYPSLIWVYSNVFVGEKAVGSLIQKNNRVIGSDLLAQKFTRSSYFWPRPSATDFSPSSSGASNLGPTSVELRRQFQERKNYFSESHLGAVPQELLSASASGLDPHLSLESVEYQLMRVAQSRGISASTLQSLVQELTEKPQYGIFGETRVNVLKLNMALDSLRP